jgi:hypothetical protein
MMVITLLLGGRRKDAAEFRGSLSVPLESTTRLGVWTRRAR